MARATDWTDRLAERAVLELMRSTSDRRPRMTWAQWRKALEKRTPAELSRDLRKIASGGLMQKADITRDTILQAADLIDEVFGSQDQHSGVTGAAGLRPEAVKPQDEKPRSSLRDRQSASLGDSEASNAASRRTENLNSADRA